MTTTPDLGFELHGERTPVRTIVRDTWRQRSLIRALARRDFYTRYRRPSLGTIWSVAIPLIQAVVLSIVFTRIVRVEVDVPFPVFILTGIVPWTFFSGTLSAAVRSITGAAAMASKVYFPRTVLPLATVGTAFYGFIPTQLVMIAAALVYGIDVTPRWAFILVGIVSMVGLAAAFGLVLAALQVYFRDIAYILSAVLQAWFYGSAVFFPIEMIPPGILRTLVLANPATGMIEMFRIAFIEVRWYSFWALASTAIWTVALLVVASLLYRRYDRVFVDRL